jgi:hypothetical protein
MVFSPDRFQQETVVDSPESEELSNPNIEAGDAMASAMMQVQSNFVKLAEVEPSYWQHKSPTLPSLDEELARISQSKCHAGSESLLFHLANSEHFSEQFEAAFLLISRAAKGFYNNPHWKLHVYAVTKSKEGIWRAASPANHTNITRLPNVPEGDSLPKTDMTRIHEAGSLEELLNSITRQDGGIWPSEAEIISALESPDYQLPHDEMSENNELSFIIPLIEYRLMDSQTHVNFHNKMESNLSRYEL